MRFGVWPTGTVMFTVPPVIDRPSRVLPPTPAPVTTTPPPMFRMPLETAMPWPPVFWMVTLDSVTEFPVPAATWTAIPESCPLPSRVRGAAASEVMPEPALSNLKPAGLPTPGLLKVMVIGPLAVVRMMFGGKVMGRVSAAASPRV